MKITEAARRRRSLYLLRLDNGREVSVDRRTFEESPYREGGDITEEELTALLSHSMYNRAHDRALYLLGLRDYACRELEKKLLDEATPEIASQVVERLREVGLLDDEAYARRAAVNMSEYKGMPRRRVEQELRRRGVDGDLAQEAASDLEREDFQQALALIEKVDNPDSRRRVVAALARRGFSYSAVRQAMELYLQRDIDDEEYEDGD